ncbi:Hypothetical protein, conserved [Brucella ceti str. Cudo]|uniref:Uncharacterized protein n=1 Tax=Brucella ceti str. Cudo TaxID=595497 RepID=C0G5K5_9HYPH|nr:Hypothetical protein, conserved [Brucella ceti str. Cudo]EEY25931.1 predicted protein [Brucella sp. F5/99]
MLQSDYLGQFLFNSGNRAIRKIMMTWVFMIQGVMAIGLAALAIAVILRYHR